MRKSLACLACILPALLACANHVRFIEERSEERVTLLATERVAVELPDPVSEARLRGQLWLERERTDRLDQRITRFEDRVPWRAHRELYELPLGLFGLPLALPAEGAHLVLRPLLPTLPLARFSGMVGAALNPALNAERRENVRRAKVDERVLEIGPEPVREREPLGERIVLVSFGEAAPVIVRTDPRGAFSVHLLDVARAARGAPLRSVRVRVAGEESAEHRAPMAGPLSRRLLRATRLAAALELPATSAESLADAVRRIGRMGFPEYARHVEDEVRQRFADDPVYVDFFRRSLAGRRAATVPANAD